MIFSACFIVLVATIKLGTAGIEIASNSNLDYTQTKEASQLPVQNGSTLHNSWDWMFSRPKVNKLFNNQANSDAQSRKIDAKLAEILSRFGPDMKPASGFRDYDDISIEISQRAWKLMHERTKGLSNDKVSALWPHVEKSLRKSNVSEKCIVAAQKVADGARSLEVWALQRKLTL